MDIKKLKDELLKIIPYNDVNIHFSDYLHNVPLLIDNNIISNYQILESKKAGLPGLTIHIKLKPKNIEWFYKNKFKNEIDIIMSQYLPITMKYEIKYHIFNKQEWDELKYFVLDKSTISN